MTSDTIPHPTDADLVRHLDGERTESDAHGIGEHISGCDQCHKAVQMFRLHSLGIEDLLAATPLMPVAHREERRRPRTPRLAIVTDKPRRPWWARPSLRAALILLGIGGATLTVTPVRGWMVDLFRGVVTPDTPSVQRFEPPQRPEVPNPISTSTVAFVPMRSTFTVHVAGNQTAGSLTLSVTNGPRVTGRIVNPGPNDGFVVTDAGLDVVNDAASIAAYHIACPASVEQVVVRIGNDVVRRVPRARLVDGAVEIELSSRGG